MVLETDALKERLTAMIPVRHSALSRGHKQRKIFAGKLWKASRRWIAFLKSGQRWNDATVDVREAVELLSLRGWAVGYAQITGETRFWTDRRTTLAQRLAITRANSY